MNFNRYTVHIVSPHSDKQKRFSISYFWFGFLLFFFVSFTVGIVGAFWYYLPKINEFHLKEDQYEKMLLERTQVLELYQDLNRLGQMKEIIRKNLSVVDSEREENDQDPKTYNVTYIENIPSQPPVDGFLTQRVLNKSFVWQKNHYGIDIAVNEGESVLAAASGRVIFSGWTYDLGNLIIIYHGDDYFSHYGHNQINLVQNHSIIKRGDIIALAGSTGISSGPHLHFEIWKGERVIDPLDFFPEYKEKDITVNSNGKE